ncbi:hypothetical protein PFISCL1PPCAC_4238, partial [Pristionchus fissidentatus]
SFTMIGMINLPTEGPIDFYASPKLERLNRPMALANLEKLDVSPAKNNRPPPSPATREKCRASLSLFSHRASKQPSHGYCADGRKCKDGRPINANHPSKLWEEVLMRKMVGHIQTICVSPSVSNNSHVQEEVASPVDHLTTMEKTFGRMTLLNRQTSRSEPNLCSEDKSTAA